MHTQSPFQVREPCLCQTHVYVYTYTHAHNHSQDALACHEGVLLCCTALKAHLDLHDVIPHALEKGRQRDRHRQQEQQVWRGSKTGAQRPAQRTTKEQQEGLQGQQQSGLQRTPKEKQEGLQGQQQSGPQRTPKEQQEGLQEQQQSGQQEAGQQAGEREGYQLVLTGKCCDCS